MDPDNLDSADSPDNPPDVDGHHAGTRRTHPNHGDWGGNRGDAAEPDPVDPNPVDPNKPGYDGTGRPWNGPRYGDVTE